MLRPATCVVVLVTQSWPTLCEPMNCSLPGSSVHGILQARTLEWVAIPFSRWSSQPKDQTRVSCIIGRFFYIWAIREAQTIRYYVPGAGERHSTHDKGHEEGGSAYAKVGSSLRSPPGYSRASTHQKKPESAYFIALCSHLWLYWGLSPTTISLSLSKS